MRLLICTQAVDRNEPVLGFMHRWIEELAKRSEHVIVICLRGGERSLPKNVEVIVLGERMKFLRALEVCSIALSRRGEYDRVFVHMNQEYILAAGWLWTLLRKKIFMWRNHYRGSTLTDIAAVFCTKVFCTSRFSYTAKYKKTTLMPVGVDAGRFAPVSGVTRVSNSILFLARLAPSKRVHVFVEAMSRLEKTNVSFKGSIYGSPTKNDETYVTDLKEKVKSGALEGKVTFASQIPNHETPKIYSAHDIFVNLSPSGMYDKTIFEAAACGALVVASSGDFADHVDSRLVFKEDDAEDLAKKLQALLSLSGADREELRRSLATLVEKNTLPSLMDRLAAEMN